MSFALTIVLIILFITFVYTGARIEALSNQASSNQEQLKLKEKEVNELNARLAISKRDLERLIQGRIPTVMKLVPDQVLAVNKDSIKNIVFTMVTRGDSKQYEYKLVMENLSHRNIALNFRLLIFDKYGVEIGIDKISSGEALTPGESRSYSSKVNFFLEEEPAYFQFSSMDPAGDRHM